MRKVCLYYGVPNEPQQLIHVNFFVALLWKYDPTNMLLESKNGHVIKGCTIPSTEKKKGKIEDTQTSKVLGLANDKINTGTEAVFEKNKFEKDSSQVWSRHQDNKEGYFMLENKKSGYFLTAESSSKLTISGMKKIEKYLDKL